MRILRQLALILAMVALLVGAFAMTSAAKGKPGPPPECEVICVPLLPPISVECYIYCPGLEE